MHRTEGANNLNNRYTEGPPATTVTGAAMNAIQEEISNVIEDAGITLKTQGTDSSYDQLLLAIQHHIAAGTNQGIVSPFSGVTAPTGWLECDGGEISRITYANLFSVIGVIYGNGDGSSTFNLPDYRGYFLRGQDDGATIDPDAATRTDRGDGTGGDNVGSIQQDAFQGHTFGSSEGATGIKTVEGMTGGISETVRLSTGTSLIIISDGYGVPRITSESRGINKYVKYIIKY